MQVSQEQKEELLAVMPQFSASVSANDGRNEAIGIQFRMKGLNKGEPKTIKQLRQDGQALMQEHSEQICATEDGDQVQ